MGRRGWGSGGRLGCGDPHTAVVAVCRSQKRLIVREFDVVYQTTEVGWVLASVPGLGGAVNQGRDLEEARENIRELIETLLQLYREQTPVGATRETTAIDVRA